jgi:STE24 endopeptidase
MDANSTAAATSERSRSERARDYDRLHNWLFVVDVALLLGLLIAMMWGRAAGLSFRLQHAVQAVLGSNAWLVTAGYVTVVTVGYTLLLLPYAWWKGYYLEHKYELSTQHFGSWLWDEAKSLVLTIVLALIIFEAFYALLRSAGAAWWLWAALVWIVLQVVLGMLFPVVILPLFYKTAPLHRSDLEARVRELASTAGLKVVGLFRIELSAKTKKANAALAGLGRTRRILLGDTLLGQFSENEVVSVLAHEFGHFYHRHLPRMIAIACVISVAGMRVADFVLRQSAAVLGIGDVAQIATLPLLVLALFVFSLVVMPLTNFVSRLYEREADSYALDSTGDAEAFIGAMERLADQNLAHKEPHPLIEFLLHSHPSIARRVAFARKWQATKR